MSTGSCIYNGTRDVDPYKVPSSCPPGKTYQRTKGYVKIDGDVCTVSNDDRYSPDTIPCPVAYVTLLIFLVHECSGMCSNVDYLKECMSWCIECSLFIFLTTYITLTLIVSVCIESLC